MVTWATAVPGGTPHPGEVLTGVFIAWDAVAPSQKAEASLGCIARPHVPKPRESPLLVRA